MNKKPVSELDEFSLRPKLPLCFTQQQIDEGSDGGRYEMAVLKKAVSNAADSEIVDYGEAK